MSEPHCSKDQSSPGPLINGTSWATAITAGAIDALLMYAFVANQSPIILFIALAGHAGLFASLNRGNSVASPRETTQAKNITSNVLSLAVFVVSLGMSGYQISDVGAEFWAVSVFIVITLSTKYLQPTVYTGL
ncbi:MAG: hypothetical protein Q3974_00880 [Rothia sp. (in: high G+C Gram-positive bacteria)]|nr:hypothetical protein [Rothia sp. (in: high G+C Gram-positive bacteria)]